VNYLKSQLLKTLMAELVEKETAITPSQVPAVGILSARAEGVVPYRTLCVCARLQLRGIMRAYFEIHEQQVGGYSKFYGSVDVSSCCEPRPRVRSARAFLTKALQLKRFILSGRIAAELAADALPGLGDIAVV
jgi:hypothetical protein